MDSDFHSRMMMEYLKSKVLRKDSLELDVDTPLVTSGLVDSFALVDVLLELEKITGRRIPASRVSPKDLNSVREMLKTAERLGMQKKKLVRIKRRAAFPSGTPPF
jgi:acyl carrier protein